MVDDETAGSSNAARYPEGRTPRVERTTRSGGVTVRLSGTWVLRALLPQARTLYRLLTTYAREPTLEWDLREVDTLDAAGALLLWRSWGRRRPLLLLRPEHELA